MQETPKPLSTKHNPVLTMQNRIQNPSKRKTAMSLKRKESKMEADTQRYRRQVGKIVKAVEGLEELSQDTGAMLIYQSDNGTFEIFCTNDLMKDVWKNGVNEVFREKVQDYLNENRDALKYKGKYLDDPELEKEDKKVKDKGSVLTDELRVIDKEGSHKINQTRTAVLKVTAKTPSVEKTIEKTATIRRQKEEYRKRLFRILEMMTVEEMEQYLNNKTRQTLQKSAADFKILTKTASSLKKRKNAPEKAPKPKSRKPVDSSSSTSDSLENFESSSETESSDSTSYTSRSYSSSSSSSSS